MTSPALWPALRRDEIEGTLGSYLDFLTSQGRDFTTYSSLWEWSVDDLEGFWRSVWEFFELGAFDGDVVTGEMPEVAWFKGAALNYASRALKGPDEALAVLGYSQTREPMLLTYAALRDQVARARTGLSKLGVTRGDRVAAFLPNIPETIVAFLATASLGAIWSSCAPEFGAPSVIDRFKQIEPKVLIAVDGYRHGATPIDRSGALAEIVRGLPTLEAVVMVPYLNEPPSGSLTWTELLSSSGPLELEMVPFDHPLYVLFSSGTTGPPKSIVHSHGGITIEHVKALGLHLNLGGNDRFCWFTTTGWMMWNFLVSGLLLGAGVVTFDGSPGAPDLGALWRVAAEAQATFLGLGAPLLMTYAAQIPDPHLYGDLSSLRGVGATGAPLAEEGFTWVRSSLGANVRLHSISGGTDVCTAFVGMSPMLEVRAGEISGPYLGALVESFDEDGQPCRGIDGELVITKPLPSMPIGFWGDDDRSRYRVAYFEHFHGVWDHGDWIRINDDRSCVISGRSDATLNRSGVRMGTAELYSILETDEDVVDSLVIHLDTDVDELIAFVQLRDGVNLDDEIRTRLRGLIRSELSPRHVPDTFFGVSSIPRTGSGKKLEVPIKRLFARRPGAAELLARSVADVGSLDDFNDLVARRADGGTD